jgi:hypothetical protein
MEEWNTTPPGQTASQTNLCKPQSCTVVTWTNRCQSYWIECRMEYRWKSKKGINSSARIEINYITGQCRSKLLAPARSRSKSSRVCGQHRRWAVDEEHHRWGERTSHVGLEDATEIWHQLLVGHEDALILRGKPGQRLHRASSMRASRLPTSAAPPPPCERRRQRFRYTGLRAPAKIQYAALHTIYGLCPFVWSTSTFRPCLMTRSLPTL